MCAFALDGVKKLRTNKAFLGVGYYVQSSTKSLYIRSENLSVHIQLIKKGLKLDKRDVYCIGGGMGGNGLGM